LQIAAPLAGSLGLATWVLHGRIPPGTGYGSLPEALAATFATPLFWQLFLLFATLSSVLWIATTRVLERRWEVPGADLRNATAPLLWGAAVPIAAPLLDSFSFWCSAPPLAALGVGFGALLAMRRCRGLGVDSATGGRDAWRPALTLLAIVVPLVLLIGGWSPPSGDEPHYLLVAHSILTDGDLDVTDEYEDEEYEPFHPGLLFPHTKRGMVEGSHYSMHGIGLPIALVPAYALGRQIGPGAMVALPRAFLILLYGLFAWILYGFVEEMAGDRAARWGTAATVLLAPLLFSSLYLFSEVPAMLLAITGFRGARKPSGARLGAAIALAALPWIGVKYIPLAAAIVLYGIVAGGREDIRRRVVSMAPPLAVSLALHAGYTWLLYGSVSPAAIYLGVGPETGAPAMGGNWSAYVAAWPHALGTAVGYFLDQKEGLLLYGPHFLLAAAGLAWMWKKRRFDSVALGLIAASYIGPYALSQQLSGQGPPVRPLMAVLWVLAPALGIGLAMATDSRAYNALRGGLVALSTGLTLAYASQPYLLPHDYPVDASRLVEAYSPRGSDWWRLFPQWVEIEAPNWPMTALWTGVAVLLVVYLWRRGAAAADSEAPATAWGWLSGAGAWGALCTLVLLHHALVVTTDRHQPTEMANGLVAWVAQELPEVGWAEAGGIWATPGRPVDFVLTSQVPLRTLDDVLRALVETEVEASVQGSGMSGRAAPGRDQIARLVLGAGRRHGDGYAYHGRLYASDGAAPADIEGGRDERVLGVFFQIGEVAQ